MADKRPVREADLYPPLKAWLEANGYTVRAEVGNCDIAASRDGELVIVEMKRAINLDLLLQVVKRQEAAESVYAAVPAPKTNDRRWRGLTRLLRRLEVGLVVVYMDSSLPRADVIFHPVRQERHVVKAATRSLLTEIAKRTLDLNAGGTNRRLIMTAYREEALRTAAVLQKSGDASPSALRHAGAPDKAGAILRANHYGWFERVAKGVYRLTSGGREALDQHRELVDTFEI